MKLGYQTNTWGGVVGHPAGVTSIKDLFYLTPGSMKQALRDIAAAGYEGFELFDGNLMEYADRKDEFRALLEETGLKMLGVYSGGNFIFPDVLDEELWRVEEAAKLAQEFGAIHLVVGGGGVRVSGPTEEDYVRLAKALDSVVNIAEQYGLVASYHPHLGTIVEGPEQLEKVMSRSRINLCADTAHVAAGGGDSADLIRTYRDQIKYIHLKDLQRQPFAFVPLGEGELDFGEIMDALDELDYDGWITVELDSYSGSNREAAETSRKHLESLRK